MKIKDFCTFAPKSKIKAGQAIKDGQYMFFTSSKDENKRYIDYLYDGEAIIMGTGGNATLHYYKGKYAVSTDCVVLNPDERIRCKYLYYFFLANMAILEAGFKGAGLKHTNRKYIENIVVSKLSTFDEQDSVIKILDKISDIIRFRNLELKVFDNLIKARFVEMFGDPVSNPYGWKKAKLSELADIKIGPFGSVLHKNDYIENGHPVINPLHIIDGRVAPDYKLTISEEKYRALNSYQLKKGDVVLGRRGEMGRCAVVLKDQMLCGTGSLFIRSKGEVSPDFLQKIISYPTFKLKIKDMSVGVTMQNLNVPIVSNFEIIVPPKEIQKFYYSLVRQVNKSKFALINDIL